MRKRVLVIIGVAVVVIAILISWYLLTQRHVARLIEQGRCCNVLVLGLDNVGGSSRSDTMMLVSIGPNTPPVLLSLPRDLRVKFANNSFHKLNAAYPLGGANLACQTVSDLLGVDVPFYITMGYDGLEKLIDNYGGVVVDVEQRMKYDDKRATPPLHIDIQPGKQVLNGETALEYMRYRNDTGDVGRIRRQQKLLRAFLDKNLQQSSIGELRQLVRDIRPHLSTNLSLIDMYDLAKLASNIQPEYLQTAVVPGTPVLIDGISYLELDAVATEQLVAQLIRGVNPITPEEIRVAVFNGNGGRLIATNTANYLREQRFNISKVANADSFDYERTYIIVLGSGQMAFVLNSALSSPARVVLPGEIEEHYLALEPFVPVGTDLILVAGTGFEVPAHD